MPAQRNSAMRFLWSESPISRIVATRHAAVMTARQRVIGSDETRLFTVSLRKRAPSAAVE